MVPMDIPDKKPSERLPWCVPKHTIHTWVQTTQICVALPTWMFCRARSSVVVASQLTCGAMHTSQLTCGGRAGTGLCMVPTAIYRWHPLDAVCSERYFSFPSLQPWPALASPNPNPSQITDPKFTFFFTFAGSMRSSWNCAFCQGIMRLWMGAW